jgi:hypothetical protein
MAKARIKMGTSPKRDLRIDLFRGLALVIIYIDHIPTDRLSHLTLRNFGFTSAADIFVLLAGLSFALAYAPRLDVRGARSVVGQVGRRVVTIYAAHLLVLLAGLGLLVAINQDAPLDLYVANPPSWAGSTLSQAIAMSFTLQYQPPYFDILPLYIVLLLCAVPLLLLARIHWSLALSASALVWLLTEVYTLNFPSTRSASGWYFDPMSWQIIFATGLCIGLFSLRGQPLKRTPWLTALCVLIILASLVLVFPCRHYGPLSSLCYFEPLSHITGLLDRQTPWRFLNTVAWVYLIVRYVPRDARWLANPLSQVLTRMGKHSLVVFSTGTLLSLIARIFLSGPGTGWLAQIGVFVFGTAVLALTAYLLDSKPRNTAGWFEPGPKSV